MPRRRPPGEPDEVTRVAEERLDRCAVTAPACPVRRTKRRHRFCFDRMRQARRQEVERTRARAARSAIAIAWTRFAAPSLCLMEPTWR